MPTIDPSSIAIAGLFFSLLALYGLFRSQKISEEDFIVGGRNVKLFQLAGTVSASVMGGGVILVYAEYAFRYGISSLWMIAGLVIGILLLSRIVKQLKSRSDEQRFCSLPDYYSYIWGRKSGLLATVIVLLWTFGFILMQLISAGQVLSHLTGLSYTTSVVLSSVTVASYLIASGFRAVIITDTIQYFALLLLLLLLCLYSPASSLLTKIPSLPAIDFGEGLGFFILGALNIIVSADLWQRIYAAKTETAARRGLMLSAALITVAAVLMLVPVLYVKTLLPNTAANLALTTSLGMILPKWALGFGLAALLATVISSLDTMIFLFSLAISHDIGVRQLHLPVIFRVKNSRIWMVLALVIGSTVSIQWRSLLDIGLALSSLGLVLAPSFLLSLTHRWLPSKEATEWGLFFGIFATAVLLFINKLTPETALCAFGVSIAFTGIGMLYSNIRVDR